MVTGREKEERAGKKRKEREVGKKAKKREQNRGEIKKTESYYWLEDNTIIEGKDKKVDCYEEVDR